MVVHRRVGIARLLMLVQLADIATLLPLVLAFVGVALLARAAATAFPR